MNRVLARCCGPSYPCSRNANGCFKVCFWNARALLHSKRETRRKKLSRLRNMVTSSLFTFVVEAHVQSGEAKAKLRPLAGKWALRHSSGVNNLGESSSSVGGSICLYDKLHDEVWDISVEVFVPGRIQRVWGVDKPDAAACDQGFVLVGCSQ